MSSESDLRQALLDTARAMNARGINHGSAGNVSVRHGPGFLITPSGLDYDDCRSTDIVAMDLSGEPRGARAPSTEWRFHRDIYAGLEGVGAVVHAHSPWATTLACLDRGIPAFHYRVAAAGGADIPCAPYATFGTQALSDAVTDALAGRKACLMAHHGMIAVERDLERALSLAVEVEHLARVYAQCLSIGAPALLDDDEMARVAERFASYGTAAGDD